MAVFISDPDLFDRVVHHVFLPPQLPQAEDKADIDCELLSLTSKALNAFRAGLAPTDPARPAIEKTIVAISNATRCHSVIDGTLSETELLNCLEFLEPGHSLPLRIQAQNAGLFITHSGEDVLFEAFELAPQNQDVLGANCIVRQFPARAVLIPRATFESPQFRAGLAQALSTMSSQAAPHQQPQVRKATECVDEDRDTTHPGIVCELLVAGLLGSYGEPAGARSTTICKRTRDDVLWNDAERPWRRSPMWLLIRVVCQLICTRSITTGRNVLYKAFMTYLVAQLLGDSVRLNISTDLQYAMSCKVARRLQKLGPSVPPYVQNHLHRMQGACNETISRRWAHVRANEPNSCHSLPTLARLNFEEDSATSLSALDEYISSLRCRAATSNSSTFEPQSEFAEHPSMAIPILKLNGADAYKIANLKEFEEWSKRSLRDWARFTTAAEADSVCSQLAVALRHYHELAKSIYDLRAKSEEQPFGQHRNPEGLSGALLTTLEVWIALDECALSACPLLASFNPCIPTDCLQHLLLPSREQLTRLVRVEQYLTDRRSNAVASIFTQPNDKQCFAVRCFDQDNKKSSALKDLLEEYEHLGEQGRQEKLRELQQQVLKYEQKKKAASELEHAFYQKQNKSAHWPYKTYTTLEHDSTCQKCILDASADRMSMEVFEDPLPFNEQEAKSVVFELCIPLWFAEWRDSTVFVLSDVLGLENTGSFQPKNQYALKDDPHLSQEYSAQPNQRVVLWTKNKMHAATHRRWIRVSTADESNVCRRNATQYRYLDTATDFFIETMTPTEVAARQCTFSFTGRSKSASNFLYRPARSFATCKPNDAIAAQSKCPDHMSLDEFKELCNVPIDLRLQWYNMLLQLAMPNVDFKKEETVLVFLQCIYQAGPRTGQNDGVSAFSAHAVLRHSKFSRCLLEALSEALLRVKENWESMNALVILSSIACRLLTLAGSGVLPEQCLLLLKQIRLAAYQWLLTLRSKAQQTDDQTEYLHFLSKAVEVALVCSATFNVGRDGLEKILANPEDSAILIDCAITVCERPKRDKSWLYTLLDAQLKQVLFFSRPLLQANHEGLDIAIKRAWSGYEASASGWSSLGGNIGYWMTTHSSSVDQIEGSAVHYNLLSGELRVAGLGVKAPPLAYTKHETFQKLFKSNVEVLASGQPGMSFSAKGHFGEGFSVDLGLTARDNAPPRDLLVVARNGGDTFQVVPPRIFHGQFPDQFVHEMVHWYHVESDTVQFRPAHAPWSASGSDIWTLARKQQTQKWVLQHGTENGRRRLLSVTSPSATAISIILAPLVEASKMIVVFMPGSQLLDVQLPTVQLGFTLKPREKLLRSKEFRGMAVDEKQSSGVLIGLKNKLVLHATTGTRNRRLLVPEGKVRYERVHDHMSVTIDRYTVAKVHDLEIDERLGRLVDHGSLQSKLYLAYLHALTSFALPDPLTRKTGTEQALYILRSAAVFSFEQLTKDNVHLLTNIARLTPARCYYPADARFMQSVQWSPKLSFMSQHGEFYKAVEALFSQAQRSRIFYPNSDVQIPTLDHVTPELLDRELAQNAMIRVEGFGAEHHTRSNDAQNTKARDLGDDLQRCSRPWRMASLLNSRTAELQWQPPARGVLWSHLEGLDHVFGANKPLEKGLFRYDGILVQTSEQKSIAPYLLGLYRTLTQESTTVDLHALRMWLATLAFSKDANLRLIQVVASFYTADSMRGLVPPDAESFCPANGTDADLETIQKRVAIEKVTYDESPDATAPLKKTKMRLGADKLETETMAELRRREDYERRSEAAVKALSNEFMGQWKHAPGQPPVSSPATGEARCKAYIDVPAAMQGIAEIFEAWANNRALKLFCEQLEDALGDLPITRLVVPDWSREKALPPAEIRSHVTAHDIFTGIIPDIGRDIVLPSMSLRNGPSMSNSSLDDSAALGRFIDSLVTREAGAYEEQYVDDLRQSLAALRERNEREITTFSLPGRTVLNDHLRRCNAHLTAIYEALKHTAKIQLERLSGDCVGLQWPRISPSLFLEQLSRGHWHMLEHMPGWREAIIQYGLAITAVQRAERMLDALVSENEDDLRRELANVGHTNWDPRSFPETLLLEIEGSILIREVQESIASEVRKTSGGNQVLQLVMGDGKSSVISPMVAAALANGEQLVRVIVGKAQSKQMAQVLISKLGGIIGRRIYYLPYSRALKLRKAGAQAVFELCQECMREGGVLLVQPEHLLSFKLTSTENYIAGNEDAGETFLRTQEFFDQTSRDIIDESDENLSVKFELVYTMGLPGPIEGSSDRWSIIHQILGLVQKHAPTIGNARSGAVECIKGAAGGFLRTRLLDETAGEQLIQCVADDICENGLHELPAAADLCTRAAIRSFIGSEDPSPSAVEAVRRSSFWSKEYKTALLLVRGLLAGGILDFVLRTKRWRVHYGLASRVPRMRLAVPYRAKDNPTPRSEFSHPDVQLLLTSLSYYYGGMEDDDLFALLSQLMTSDQAEQDFHLWVRKTDMPSEFRNINSINLRDETTCKVKIFPYLRQAKAAVDWFLSHSVFPKDVKEYPFKLSSSGCDLGRKKLLPTRGFSGTQDAKIVLPLDVEQLDLPAQRHTDALVLGYLLQPANSVTSMAPARDAPSTDADQLLDLVMQLSPPIDVLLDPGAQILELDNLGVAKTWLARSDATKREAAIYCNDNDELCVVDRSGRFELLQTSSYAARMDRCIVYLDEAHTRGIDLKLPPKYRAACTLGSGLVKDRLLQACMRMRKLGKGQTVVFVVSSEIERQIRNVSKLSIEGCITVPDVLRWSIAQTYGEMRHNMSLWAAQNDRFNRQEELWEKTKENGKRSLTKTTAQKFLEPEGRNIESRYEPKMTSDTPLSRLAKDAKLKSAEGMSRSQAIIDRCQLFGLLEWTGRKLTEEQEREVSKEADVDAERVIEKPAPAKAATHSLWKGWRKFMDTGILSTISADAPMPVFETLLNTTAGKEYDISQLRPQLLLASRDFAKTVIAPGKGSLSDSFLRSVQWVLTGRKTRFQYHIDHMIVISPFEAAELMNEVVLSPFVALHLYRPRTNMAYTPLDDLDLYTISQAQLNLTIHEDYIVQLNLFAGQLYFSSYKQYLATGRFLGLATGGIQKGWRVSADGFVEENEDGKVGRPDSAVKVNPVQFFKIVISKLRRNGEDISRTHVGQMLANKTLQPADFE
ncbi:hypothetical protein CBER1_09871 [Cercospora berteroae]|uniref:ubiquitinyl hydrolase 1 n=1 Tax=Cercospora berteroae TaxID=357750 RepID=A0A2S6BVS0_9PEZI|nr:hypothetical protein CBER1_09871 [Cercospora berteroae]